MPEGADTEHPDQEFLSGFSKLTHQEKVDELDSALKFPKEMMTWEGAETSDIKEFYERFIDFVKNEQDKEKFYDVRTDKYFENYDNFKRNRNLSSDISDDEILAAYLGTLETGKLVLHFAKNDLMLKYDNDTTPPDISLKYEQYLNRMGVSVNNSRLTNDQALLEDFDKKQLYAHNQTAESIQAHLGLPTDRTLEATRAMVGLFAISEGIGTFRSASSRIQNKKLH